ncbi:MAG TPA: amidohydrolase family protein [Pseudolabrys sp.]|nr:amidohydrolase family protein [Pseudolabrys sp.]
MAAAQFPPPGACDCHVHVIGPKPRYPLAPDHQYTPMDAPVNELAAMLKRLGLDRVVIVQPSFYGTDNACTLDGMGAVGSAARGVAVLPDSVAHAELDRLHGQGVRGLRVNIASDGGAALDTIKMRLEAAAAHCAVHGWHVQIFVAAEALEPLSPILRGLPVDTVIDHFGLVSPARDNGARAALLRLVESGNVWVKISGAYRMADDYRDPRIGPLARALCAANPERIVWGSDWPHTPRHDQRGPDRDVPVPFQDIDPADLLALVPRWLEDDALVHRVLVDNPARLYGFP